MSSCSGTASFTLSSASNMSVSGTETESRASRSTDVAELTTPKMEENANPHGSASVSSVVSATTKEVGGGSAKITESATSTSTKSSNGRPKYLEMVRAAIKALKEKKGSSRVAILRYIQKNYDVASSASMINTHVKLALRNGVKSGSLKQKNGVGATGSFMLGDDGKKPGKKATPSTKKVAKKATPKDAKKAVKSTKKPMKKAAAKPKISEDAIDGKGKKPIGKKTMKEKSSEKKKSATPTTPKVRGKGSDENLKDVKARPATPFPPKKRGNAAKGKAIKAKKAPARSAGLKAVKKGKAATTRGKK